MIQSKSLLYPTYQKLYSALLHLEKFSINNDLFDNISSLDSFFSEYRAITFILQSSLEHTEFKNIYPVIRDKHLSDDVSKWMKNTRNDVIHSHPYELNKKVIVTIYSPIKSLILSSKIFTINTEKNYSSIEHEIKKEIQSLNLIETHFSIEYLFYKDDKQQLFQDISQSIINIFNFLDEMASLIKENNILTTNIKNKILKLSRYKLPNDFLFIQDYVYYAGLKQFEISQRGFMLFSKKNQSLMTLQKNIRSPINTLNNIHSHASKNLDELFIAFFIMHFISYREPSQKVMPTFMIVYEDETYALHSFLHSIRTTLYREVNQIASMIKNNKIKAILFTCETYTHKLGNFEQLYSMPYPERSKCAISENAVFYMIKKDLSVTSCILDQDKLNDEEYVSQKLNNSRNSDMQIQNSFLAPIIEAFKLYH